MAKSLVLISENDKERTFGAELAKFCKADFIAASSVEDATSKSGSESPLAVLFNLSLSKQIRQHLDRAASGWTANRLHALTSPEHLAHANELIQQKIIDHVVVGRFDEIEDAARTYSKIVHASLLTSPRGIHSFVPADWAVQEIALDHSSQKGLLATAILFQLMEMNVPTTIAEIASGGVDELLTNAIFDAPQDENGNRLYRALPKDSDMPLGGRNAVTLQFSVHDNNVIITVIDLIGSLNRKVIMDHLSEPFLNQRKVPLESERLGAGLGLSLILRSGASLHLGCQPGKRTEVTMMFRIIPRVARFRRQLQFISTRIFE